MNSEYRILVIMTITYYYYNQYCHYANMLALIVLMVVPALL